LDRRALIARVKDFQHANPSAIIDRGELVEPPTCPWNPLEKLDVDLETMAWLRLLVARPAVRMPAVFLVRWQAVHAVLAQNAMNGGAGDR
jgi:hypothetical protein